MASSFQVSHAASPDGAECGHNSRAAHLFLEIYSSAVPVSAHLILPGAHGAQIVFAAEFVHAALPPTWERSAFRFGVFDSTTPVEALIHSSTSCIVGESASTHKHTVARKIEWAVLPALAYSCTHAFACRPSRAPPRLS
jgi:hypothetical protein